jgi:hypothetical protein
LFLFISPAFLSALVFDFGFAFLIRAFLRASSLPAVAGVSVVNFGFVVNSCSFALTCPP